MEYCFTTRFIDAMALFVDNGALFYAGKLTPSQPPPSQGEELQAIYSLPLRRGGLGWGFGRWL